MFRITYLVRYLKYNRPVFRYRWVDNIKIDLCMRSHMCCSYSETGKITVLTSVARIRLVKPEKTYHVLVICSVEISNSVIITCSYEWCVYGVNKSNHLVDTPSNIHPYM
jgi:hypothetical protein